MARTLVVIPAYREEDTVAEIVRRVQDVGFDCVVVDDGSPDRTARRARDAGAVVLQLPTNMGIGAAMRCGFRYAITRGYSCVVQCDADGQHPPEEIPRLVRLAAERGSHLLVASRFVDGSGEYDLHRARRGAMKLLSRLAYQRGGVRVHDSTSGFRVVNQPLLSEFARAYPAHYLGDTFEVLVATGRAGYQVDEVPADFLQRVSGEPSSGMFNSISKIVRVGVSVLAGLGPVFAPITRDEDLPSTSPTSTMPPAADLG
jgi:glycosyltransferase involved in cell wall biosynthesis